MAKAVAANPGEIGSLPGELQRDGEFINGLYAFSVKFFAKGIELDDVPLLFANDLLQFFLSVFWRYHVFEAEVTDYSF